MPTEGITKGKNQKLSFLNAIADLADDSFPYLFFLFVFAFTLFSGTRALLLIKARA